MNLKNLIIKTFFVLILSIINSCNTKPKSTYDEKTQTTRYEKPLTPPILIPFDITKKGNQIELNLKIKKDVSHFFDLEFHYDDPTMSKYYIVNFTRWFFGINPLRKMSQEELDEALKDRKRVRKLVGYGDTNITIENGVTKFNETYYPGISTPIHLIITKIADDGRKKVVFDKIFEELERAGTGTHYWRRIKGLALEPGNYQVIAKALKDSPEFIGTAVYLQIFEWFAK